MTDETTTEATTPKDQFGYPIGTRWIRVEAVDAAGNKVGHAVADVLNYPNTAHAQSACFAGLVKACGDRFATARVTWGN